MHRPARSVAIVVLAVLAAAAPTALSQVSLTTIGTAYTQSFDTLANSGTGNAWTDNSTIPGWFSTRTTYNAGTGSSNAGALYSFGAAAPATDRAIGGAASNSTGTFYWAVRFVNNTGSTITSLDIAYTGEQWRDGGAATPVAQTMVFEYQTAAAGTITDADTPNTGWTPFSALDFTSPTFTNTGAGTALDGNLAANRAAKSATLAVTVAPGAEVWLRWRDANDAGNDHGLAVDDLSVTPQGVAVDLAPSVTSTTPANAATGVAPNADLSVTFSEAVNVTGSWYTISCGTSGAHSATVTGGPTTFTINPDTDFTAGESCTATIVAAQVTDQDANDPPDAMAADYVWSFQVASATPALSINDVTLAEGDSGTTNFVFTVSLSAPAGAGGVTFDIATADGTAQDDNPAAEDNDYVGQSLTGQTIPAGSSTYAFTVAVNGDTAPEANETFFVNVTNITGATAADAQGLGTINNDDVAITPIHDIQGPGTSSPIVGSSVTTRGIVTAVKFNNGFFIQEPDASVDADPATSEGIFVFTSSAPPAAAAVGNLVQVTGTVTEYNQTGQYGFLTELTAPEKPR